MLFRKNGLGEREEPYEYVVVDVDEEFSGSVIERMAARKGNVIEFAALGKSGKVSYRTLLAYVYSSVCLRRLQQ